MKTVLIGAGSQWGPHCLMDFCCSPALSNSSVVLVDVHEERLHWAGQLGRRIVEQAGVGLTLSSTTDRRAALQDANYVIVAVAVGGDACWKLDVRIPQQFGVHQSVGDTMGPGGFFRGWRHMFFYEGLLRDMEELCPQAFLINLANPMNALCRYIERTSTIRSMGLCHGVRDTKRVLNEEETSPRDYEIIAAGNNHFLFALDVKSNGRDAASILAQKSPEFWKRHGVLHDLWLRFGLLTINEDRHPAEFLPWYLTEENGWGEKFGVAPEPGEFKLRDKLDPLESLKRSALEDKPLLIQRSTEPVADLIELTLGARDGLLHVNTRNNGAIPDVPHYGNVEIPAQFVGGKMFPLGNLRLPRGLSIWVSHTCEVQEMTVEAFIARSRRMAITALGADALVLSYEKAEKIFDALYAAEQKFLPVLD